MPILSGDIKLVASQVMDDVPEGGGAPTANVIADGVSNAIFPDISEVDRAGGRVNLRKLHVTVQTADRDTYLGSNIIVAEPPADPRVSVTLFTTESTFDRRDAASSRIESYLNLGPMWPGILYENHIAGQRSVQLLQDTAVELPAIGQTLVLVQNEGATNQVTQYIRTTAVETVTRTFYDDQGQPYSKAVVTLSISDALRTDFTGSPASKALTRLTTAARVRDTVVADAGTYVGVQPLTLAADLGDFTVTAASVYTQLVPSAQTETPITDLRTNGLSAALVATGGAITQSLSLAFTTSTNMHVGGPIYPGSLSITRDGVTATDAGGLLISAAAEVGQVDYDNGIVKLSTNLWGGSGGTHQVTFTPATIPELISDQRAIRVTAESRALNYTFVMDDVPLARTLSVSYLAQGRWYVLRDNGAGVLKGISSAYGIGTLNYSTGAVSVTLGALPDVGSSVVVQSYSKGAADTRSNTNLTNGGRLYVPINTDGALSEEAGSTPIKPGTLLVSWGGLTATDNGAGALSGAATGTVDYARGVVRISPSVLPAAGTVFELGRQAVPLAMAEGVALSGGSLGATDVAPGSVRFSLNVVVHYAGGTASYSHGTRKVTPTAPTRHASVTVVDDGAGHLQFTDAGQVVPAGTINYAAGTLACSIAAVPLGDAAGPAVFWLWVGSTGSSFGSSYSWDASLGYPDSASFLSRSMSIADAVIAQVHFSAAASSSASNSVPVDQWLLRCVMASDYVLKGARFGIGSVAYAQMSDDSLLRDIDPTNGGGNIGGAVSGGLGAVFVSSWPVGASSAVSNWRALVCPPSTLASAPFCAASSSFRTASSPLRPASVSVLGTMQDGTSFNVTADSDGKINGTRVKGRVDYQYGLVELYFVNPAGDPDLNTDLSFLQIAGLTSVPADLAMSNSLRYNAVAYSYLPLDADLLGIDPVRLPSDGRVPIFRAGGFAVVGHTGKITATVSNGQTINAGRVRLSRVRVVGFDGAVINTGYTADLEAGTVTFTDVAGYSQPVTIEHRIEDMAVVREAQISGEVTFTRALTHDYPVGSFLSSALVAGDLKSRVSVLFDQATWTNVWADSIIGSPATGTFNDVLAPIVVTNIGAVTERWALIFTNTTTFNIVGEHVGVLGTGSISTDLSPLNPATNQPYFTLPALGWGLGWSTGNVLRFNTVGAMTPVWVVRTVQQGPNTGIEHAFTLLSRGDVDRP